MDELVKRLRICATEAGACKTCELDSNPSCTDYLMMQAADAIEELTRRCEQFQYMPPPAWIPVTERLPERFKSVLTVDKYGVIAFNWISGDGENWSTGYHITHWMTLPEKPKGE